MVNASPLARTVPSAFFKDPEVGMAVMEMVNESPSESVGAAKLSGPSIASSLMLTVVSEPATGMLLEGAMGV